MISFIDFGSALGIAILVIAAIRSGLTRSVILNDAELMCTLDSVVSVLSCKYRGAVTRTDG